VGICFLVSHDKLCSSTGGGYSSSSDLGIRNITTSADGITTPLCTSVVNRPLIVGVVASAVPVCYQYDYKETHTIEALGNIWFITDT
jgi:hypothetical protein